MEKKVFFPNLQKEYPIITKALGIYMYDEDGKSYIDGSSGPLAVNIGHSVPEVVDAISKQLGKVAYAHRHTFANEPALELAEKICGMAPEGMEWVSYVSGGSEATETAIKLAREYWVEKGKTDKYKVISRWQSYHGNTLGMVAIGGTPKMRYRYAPLLKDNPHAEPCYCYRCPYDKCEENCSLECAHNVENLIKREGPHTISCMIIEPIVGPTLGVAIPKDGYLQELRRLCDKYDILFIADEVITGMGRTGVNFAVNHWNVKPDIICMAKGLAAGYAPLGAVVLQDFIHKAFEDGSKQFSHGFTYGGNPMATAAGLAVTEYIAKNNLIQNSRAMGDYLLACVKELKGTRPYMGDVRGKGLMLGIEFVKDAISKTPFEAEVTLTAKMQKACLDNGMAVYGTQACVDGVLGDGILLAPPLTVNKEQIDLIVKILAKAMDEVMEKIIYN